MTKYRITKSPEVIETDDSGCIMGWYLEDFALAGFEVEEVREPIVLPTKKWALITLTWQDGATELFRKVGGSSTIWANTRGQTASELWIWLQAQTRTLEVIFEGVDE